MTFRKEEIEKAIDVIANLTLTFPSDYTHRDEVEAKYIALKCLEMVEEITVDTHDFCRDKSIKLEPVSVEELENFWHESEV